VKEQNGLMHLRAESKGIKLQALVTGQWAKHWIICTGCRRASWSNIFVAQEVVLLTALVKWDANEGH